MKGGRGRREREGAHLWGRAGEGMPMVVAGVGTVWRGKREDRGW